jgi:hypothetical protein
MTDKDTITAAIIGELIPQFRYAAPVLLERFDRGEPLVRRTSPTDLGFDTGGVDSVFLELFKSLVPYVQMVLGWGTLSVIQAWHSSKRDARHQEELIAVLKAHIDQDAKRRQAVQSIADLRTRRDGAPFSVDDVIEVFAVSASRINTTDDDRPHG